MKTYAKMYKEMFDEIYKSPEGWPPYLTQSKFAERVAKEYAKQWVEEASKNCGYYCSGDGDACGPDNEDILNLIKKIDAQ